MIPRSSLRAVWRLRRSTQVVGARIVPRPAALSFRTGRLSQNASTSIPIRTFSSSQPHYAQSPSADALMEELNDLYATAKDEFEIAAEETEKKTVYAADDRGAAQEAFQSLKQAFERHMKAADPEVAKEVQGRVGQRIRELENALTALEESAMED